MTETTIDKSKIVLKSNDNNNFELNNININNNNNVIPNKLNDLDLKEQK